MPAKMSMFSPYHSRKSPTSSATPALRTWSCSARFSKSPERYRRPASMPHCAASSKRRAGSSSMPEPSRAAENCSGSRYRRCDVKADADPNLIVYFAGQYMPLSQARIGILTHALHYGTGVFEGIRAHWDDASQQLFILRPADHYERWRQNCAILRIALPLATEELCTITLELMRR